ncbi:MAG TPA: glucan 1,4-alpha-glucosidase [Pyrinomonadaceae bacterium]|jgi:glucoamylase|nr:glucan 1,4-alpha-glucosidase [Pyrinomonadaceae bacterium]
MTLRNGIRLTPGFIIIIILLACAPLFCNATAASGQTGPQQVVPPGAPGLDAHWASAGKDGVGTSNTLESKVWFTLAEGALTEVYYPTVDTANVQRLEFVVASGDGKRVEVEGEDTTHRIEILDARSLLFRQLNTARSGDYTITKTYTADPERHTVLINVEFRSLKGGPHVLYVYYDPSLNNSGMHDAAWTEGDALLAADKECASALVAGRGFEETSNGYLGTSDGLTTLRAEGRINRAYVRAADGNVVQVARLKSDVPFTLALGFGADTAEALKNARASLAKGFERARLEYESGWHDYVARLRRVAATDQRHFDMAAMVLKAHEDKTHRGAMIASLTVPWGGGANANEASVGGYHLVWARDLYEVATAFDAMGDRDAARRALDYLFTVQQKSDGSFPQNSWLNGKQFYGGLQMDQVAYPLILAFQLGRADAGAWTKHIKPAADFLIRHGPMTEQERWEEEKGYSPSTISAEIAGLVCAAELARRNKDEGAAAIYLAAADDWARNLDRWTATATGPHGDGNYYLRVTENDDPDDGARLEINSNGGVYDERSIVDAGFLEATRLGIKGVRDPLVAKSLAVVDRVIKVETPNGAAWYRYNHDAYGDRADGGSYDARRGVGRLWPLLTGERGEYELARGEVVSARRRLDAMRGFAGEGMMMPEQVWDRPASPRPGLRFGEGTASATPLAWASAQYIRLARNLEEGRNLETPETVAARYATGAMPLESDIHLDIADDEVLLSLEAGTRLPVSGRLPAGARAYVFQDGRAREVAVDKEGGFKFELEVPAGESVIAFAARAPDNSSTFNRRVLRGFSQAETGGRAVVVPKLSADLEKRVREANRSPVIEANSAVFLYRGPARRVEVVGDFTNWAARGLAMRELEGTDIKYYVREFAARARAEYKLIADGEWMLDPLNPDRVENGLGGFNSFLRMPGYRETPISGDEGERGISVDALEVGSGLLDGSRRAWVYLPPGYKQSTARYPVLYVQDGMEYVTRARATLIAHDLIKAGKVAPFIIVFVLPGDRMKDYWANDAFADFMATELVPFIDARYRTKAERNGRALMGASLGGVISIWTALRHADTFARVGGQSSSFQIDNERIVGALARLGPMRREQPLKFYFDVGRMESVKAVHRRVRVMLAARGYSVAYAEAETGHNWTSWRDRLANALVALWSD